MFADTGKKCRWYQQGNVAMQYRWYPSRNVASVADTSKKCRNCRWYQQEMSLIPGRNVASVDDTHQELSPVSLIQARNIASIDDTSKKCRQCRWYQQEIKPVFLRPSNCSVESVYARNENLFFTIIMNIWKFHCELVSRLLYVLSGPVDI